MPLRRGKVHCLVHIPEKIMLIQASRPGISETGGAQAPPNFDYRFPRVYYSRAMNNRSTYQNMSATDANSARAAPTWRSAG